MGAVINSTLSVTLVLFGVHKDIYQMAAIRDASRNFFRSENSHRCKFLRLSVTLDVSVPNNCRIERLKENMVFIARNGKS